MIFTNKIEAIKELRALTGAVTFSVVKGEGNTFIVSRDSLGLNDCEDFVEACMTLGACMALGADQTKYCNRCYAKIHTTDRYCPRCGQTHRE